MGGALRSGPMEAGITALDSPDFYHAVRSGLAIDGGEVLRHRDRGIQVIGQAVPFTGCSSAMRLQDSGEQKNAGATTPPSWMSPTQRSTAS